MTPLAGNRENLWQISIHMPHTWHDATSGAKTRSTGYFNPHATYVA